MFVVAIFFGRLLQRGFGLEKDPAAVEELAELFTTLEGELFQEAYLPAFQAAQRARSRRKKAEAAKRRVRDRRAFERLEAFTEPGAARPPKARG